MPRGDSTSSPTGQALRETPPGSASGCWTRLALLGSVNWEEETGSHWPYWEGGAAPAPLAQRELWKGHGVTQDGAEEAGGALGWLAADGWFCSWFCFGFWSLNFIFLSKYKIFWKKSTCCS